MSGNNSAWQFITLFKTRIVFPSNRFAFSNNKLSTCARVQGLYYNPDSKMARYITISSSTRFLPTLRHFPHHLLVQRGFRIMNSRRSLTTCDLPGSQFLDPVPRGLRLRITIANFCPTK